MPFVPLSSDGPIVIYIFSIPAVISFSMSIRSDPPIIPPTFPTPIIVILLRRLIVSSFGRPLLIYPLDPWGLVVIPICVGIIWPCETLHFSFFMSFFLRFSPLAGRAFFRFCYFLMRWWCFFAFLLLGAIRLLSALPFSDELFCESLFLQSFSLICLISDYSVLAPQHALIRYRSPFLLTLFNSDSGDNVAFIRAVIICGLHMPDSMGQFGAPLLCVTVG